MRVKIFLSMLILGICFVSAKNVTVVSGQLDGSWVPVRQEMAGKALQKDDFAAQRLVISDSNYTFTAESVDKGAIRYADGKMDIYGREGVNMGKHFTARYKFENGELSICYNMMGDSYPEGFDTKGKRLFFLSVFKKEGAK